MIDPNPLNDDKYGLRRTDRPQPTDDGYKISIIMFMFHDKREAEIDLGKKVLHAEKRLSVKEDTEG